MPITSSVLEISLFKFQEYGGYKLQGLSIDLLIELSIFFDVSLDYILLGRELQTDALKRQIHSMLKQLMEIEQKL